MGVSLKYTFLSKGPDMKKKILVIDDEPNLVELLQLRLESHDFEVRTASNGVEGFAIIKEFLPDLIILDVEMPVMDGYTFLKEIKWEESMKKASILILTAKVKTKELFENEGVVEFMTKPFDSKALVAKVQDMCAA